MANERGSKSTEDNKLLQLMKADIAAGRERTLQGNMLLCGYSQHQAAMGRKGLHSWVREALAILEGKGSGASGADLPEGFEGWSRNEKRAFLADRSFGVAAKTGKPSDAKIASELLADGKGPELTSQDIMRLERMMVMMNAYHTCPGCGLEFQDLPDTDSPKAVHERNDLLPRREPVEASPAMSAEAYKAEQDGIALERERVAAEELAEQRKRESGVKT